MDGTARTLAYLYDTAGNRIRITHPDGHWFGALHDALNRQFYLFGEGEAPLAYSEYAAHGALAFTGRPASASWFGYDAVQRPASRRHGFNDGGGDVVSTYGYNPASQIATLSRDNPGSSPGQADAYAWTGHYAVNRAYTANGLNQYSAAGGATFGYDASGNLTSDGSRTYVYDVENRLVSSSSGAQLAYDPLGRLYQVTAPGGAVTRFLYDGDALVAEYDGAGAMLRRHVHWAGLPAPAQAGVPVLSYEGATLSAPRHLFADHQGSIVALADAPGHVVAVNAYDEYGIPGAGNVGRFQYTGQIWLAELGLYHYKARLYSPTLGRFLQTDPIGYQDQFNLYAYVRNDPVNLLDPEGGRAVVANNRIYIQPKDHDVPSVTIPNTVGASGFSNNCLTCHSYMVSSHTGLRDMNAVGDAYRRNPTPGNDRPATPSGTLNDVGDLVWGDGDTNFVRSFSVPSPDSSRFTDIIVNYTVRGEHTAAEGFVMGYGERNADGTITERHYGEGNAFIMSPGPLPRAFWGPGVIRTWTQVEREIHDDVTRRRTR